MAKGGLKFLAAVLTTGIVVTPFLGLDDLPRTLRSQIDAERTAYSQTRGTFQSARSEVEQDIHSDPALFRARSMATVFPDRFRTAEASLAAADRDMAELAKLREANRRQDRARAEQLLQREKSERTAALTQATTMQAEARRWVEMKRTLPQQLERMQADYQALRTADLSGVQSTVAKAETDWPDKKADLGTRLDALKAIPAEAEKTWQESEPLRRRAAARDYENLDYAALLTAAETLHNEAASVLPARINEVNSLTGQLYNSWDKVLVNLDTTRDDGSRAYRQKVRTIKTRLDSPASTKGDVTTDEQWVNVSHAEYTAQEKNLGMAIEHKDAGKYDFESEKTPQPAGFAYMAPPGQSNRYGHWEDRGGQSFWVFYGQYALMRDLLFNRDYRPLGRGEYDTYRDYRSSGRTYYGRDAETSAPKYGTEGSSTQSRYSSSTYAKRGGFADSQYATRGGGYGSSKYSTRGYRENPDAVAPRQYGRGSGGGLGGIFSGGSSKPSGGGWSSPSRSRPSFGGGGGRRFGGGGRRR